jgi:hypothetical protein
MKQRFLPSAKAEMNEHFAHRGANPISRSTANNCFERDAEPAADLRFLAMATVLSGGGFSAAQARVRLHLLAAQLHKLPLHSVENLTAPLFLKQLPPRILFGFVKHHLSAQSGNRRITVPASPTDCRTRRWRITFVRCAHFGTSALLFAGLHESHLPIGSVSSQNAGISGVRHASLHETIG